VEGRDASGLEPRDVGIVKAGKLRSGFRDGLEALDVDGLLVEARGSLQLVFAEFNYVFHTDHIAGSTATNTNPWVYCTNKNL
jgi:hypothetical protein